MKKIAFFVEGQTELIFISKLVKEIIGDENVYIQSEEKVKKNHFRKIEITEIESNQKYFILIRNCQSDSSVAQEIKDAYDSLVKSGYSKIFGVLDVYPKDCADIPKLEMGLKYGMKTNPIECEILLAVMEIEAWFMAEINHYKNIDEQLNLEFINENLGLDLKTLEFEKIPKPSTTLKSIYQLVGKSYTKSKSSTSRTINKLDYEYLYLEVVNEVPRFKILVNQIIAFLE